MEEPDKGKGKELNDEADSSSDPDSSGSDSDERLVGQLEETTA